MATIGRAYNEVRHAQKIGYSEFFKAHIRLVVQYHNDVATHAVIVFIEDAPGYYKAGEVLTLQSYPNSDIDDIFMSIRPQGALSDSLYR